MITASGAVEYAFEGGELTESGDAAPSVNPWTVVFTHLTGGALKMAVDPDSSVDYEQEFEV